MFHGMGAEVVTQAPRLELSLALTAAGIGVVLACVSGKIGLVPLTWEPVLFGAFGGAVAGVSLRRQSQREGQWPHAGQARWRFVRTWLVLGAVVGGLICAVVPLTLPAFIPPTIVEGVLMGAVVAALLYPACHWLLRQAGVALRARLGSLVAAADKRAIWSVTAVVLSLASMFGLLNPSEGPALIAAMACSVSIFIVAADRHARRRVRSLAGQRENMDKLDPRAEEDPRVTDLGVGEELAGRTDVGGTYRAACRRVPLLRGSVLEATVMLERCCAASTARLGIVIAVMLTHIVRFS